MNTTDEQLVQRVKAGDKAAYDLLVLKYQQRIINLALRFVKNYSDALDVAQESFIKAYKAMPNFRGDSSFYTWLYRITMNTAKNYLITKTRQPQKREQYDLSTMEQIGRNPALREEETPESLLLKDELQKEILNSLDSLPEDLHTAIILREIDGLSYEEISQIMQCPIGTVRSRIFRAREIINKALGGILKNN